MADVRTLLAIAFSLILAGVSRAGYLTNIQTVFIIVLENHAWADIKGNTNAPFANGILLPLASRCEQYYCPPGLHPSLPNYLWLEAGTNFGIFDDNDPSLNHQSTTNHLVALLGRAGFSWRTYQEDISGIDLPLTNTNAYAVRHNPFVYFDDVTGTNDANNAYGISHVRPFCELADDLAGNAVARYNFIVPNGCHNGHDACPPLDDPVQQTDNWLAAQVPNILNSLAYSNNGALFIVWDEGPSGIDGPLGMLVLSPLARGSGYFNNVRYTHSSMLRTMQEIFGVMPLLNDAANAANLSDLFTRFSIAGVRMETNALCFTVAGVIPEGTNVVEASTNLSTWNPISTNVSGTNNFIFADSAATNFAQRFYRVREME